MDPVGHEDEAFLVLVVLLCVLSKCRRRRTITSEALCRIKRRSLVRRTITFQHIVDELSERDFRESFRIGKSGFNKLLELVRPDLERSTEMGALSGRNTISAETRLALTLRLLAGASYVDIRLAFRIGRTTVYDVFHATVAALDKALSLPGLPTDPEDLNDIATKFRLSRCFKNPLPFCVGAIDGILFPIPKPTDTDRPAAYFTRKGFYAIPVQALVDSDYRFRSFSARVVGSSHDSLAHTVSGLGAFIREGKLPYPFWIVGDEAYICTDSLIVPYPISACGPVESDFNFCLSSYRVHVEQAFGQLVSRWLCLKNILRYKLHRTVQVIKLCMKLHNFCIDCHDSDIASHMDPKTREEILQEAKEWVDAFRRRRDTTARTVDSRGGSDFSSVQRNVLREIVRRSNVGRHNVTGMVHI